MSEAHTVGLAEFDQQVLAALRESPFMPVLYGLLGLSRLGEHPVPIGRLATVLGRTDTETVRLVHCHTTWRVRGGLIHVDPPFPGDRARRTLYAGHREIPMSRCVSATFVLAAVLDVSFRVEEPCAATGASIRIDFVPGGYERVDPPEAVIAVPSPRNRRQDLWNDADRKDAGVCVHGVAFVSSVAAGDWQAAHPGGRVFTVGEMFERPWIRYYFRTLRPLIHRGKAACADPRITAPTLHQ